MDELAATVSTLRRLGASAVDICFRGDGKPLGLSARAGFEGKSDVEVTIDGALMPMTRG